MLFKACIFILSVMGMIFFYFPQTATSLQCYKCAGSKQEPYQHAACNLTHNCTGAQNNCMIRILRNRESAPSTFILECTAEVDCKRLGVGCNKQQSDTTVCTKCCTSDLCNLPTAFQVTDTTASPLPTTSTADRIQVLPSTLFLAILTVLVLRPIKNS